MESDCNNLKNQNFSPAVSPSLHHHCIVCNSTVKNADYRRLLFANDGKKSKACHEVEEILDITIKYDTRIICRTCLRKIRTLKSDKMKYRNRFAEFGEKTVKKVKRVSSDAPGNEPNVVPKKLKFDENFDDHSETNDFQVWYLCVYIFIYCKIECSFEDLA